MRCDITALNNHTALCSPILERLKKAAAKQFPQETAQAVCALLDEMCVENVQIQLAAAEYMKAVKKAECYVRSVRLE